MRKLIYIALLFITNVAFGQVADVISSKRVPGTGSFINNQASHYANIRMDASFALPRHPSNGLYGAKDSSSYMYWNTTVNKVIVYKGGGLYDTLSTSVSTSIYKLASDSTADSGYVTHGYLNSHSGAVGSPLTVNKSGTGDASPFTFNGSTPKTISYNSIGAQSDLKVINALDYGVVADSVTDNNTALTNMIVACPANGCEILLPAGKIFTSGTLTFTVPVTLIGQGGISDAFSGKSAITTLISNKTTGDFVTINANNCLFKNVSFYNNATATSGTGLLLNKSIGFRMVNCSVHYFYNNVDIENGYDWMIDGCVFFLPKHWNLKIADVALPDAGDQAISNSWLYSNVTTSGIAQIEYESGGGLKMTNVKINSAGSSYEGGIYVPINVSTVDFLISNCSIENANNFGIKIMPAPAVNYANIAITGSEIQSNLPIYIDGGTSGATITGVSITGNILLAGGSAAAVTVYNSSNITVGPNVYLGGTPFDIQNNGAPVNIIRNTYGVAVGGTASAPIYDINKSNYQNLSLSTDAVMTLANIQNGDTWFLSVSQDGTGGHNFSISGGFQIGENPLDLSPGGISYIVGHQNIYTVYSNVNNSITTNSSQTGLTGNKATSGIWNTSGQWQANGGVTPDGMSPISTTMPGNSNNYAYFGMTRSGITAVGMGLDNLNAIIFGTGPSRGNGATIDTILFRLNSHTGDLMLYGKLNVAGNTTFPNYYTTSGTPTGVLGSSIVVGSGATLTITGTNQDGEITLVTGTSVSGTGSAFTITMNGFAYPTKCTPIIMNEVDLGASGPRMTVNSLTGTTWTVSAGGNNFTSSSTYIWTYHNGGY